ncbi:MAG TPA: TonB family protein [Candidatus Binatia bacterium]|nr:TonB family protein [Candidatus Binatia bacterium]
MRKVYQNKRDLLGLPIAVTIGVGMAATIFCIIPFSHMVNKPSRVLELRKSSAVDLPPPVEDKAPPPPPEPDKPPEAPPEPKLADAQQQIPLSADLEVAMGSGGALAGFGEIRALTAAQTIQDETFDASELEKKPEAVSQVAPAYPAELRKAKIDGVVTVLFVVSEEGRVEDARIENASRPEFEKPALDAIRKWRFRPGVKDGQPVRTYSRIPMRFRVASG